VIFLFVPVDAQSSRGLQLVMATIPSALVVLVAGPVIYFLLQRRGLTAAQQLPALPQNALRQPILLYETQVTRTVSPTAYLEARQRERAAPAAPSSGGTPLGLLAALAAAPQGAMALAELLQASAMNFGDFFQSIERLVDNGFLTVGGQPGSETARLTKFGWEVAVLARPS